MYNTKIFILSSEQCIPLFAQNTFANEIRLQWEFASPEILSYRSVESDSWKNDSVSRFAPVFCIVQRTGQLRSINWTVAKKSTTLGSRRRRRNLRETSVLGIASTRWSREIRHLIYLDVYYCTVTSIDRLIQTFRKRRRQAIGIASIIRFIKLLLEETNGTIFIAH